MHTTHLIHLHLAATTPDTTPPGIFLRLFIFGGLALVVFIAWFVLRGYRDSGDQHDENPK